MWINIVNYVLGYQNLYNQYYDTGYKFEHKVIFIITVFSSMFKLFKLMRIFKRMAYILTMFEHVLRELAGYFIFYCVIVIMVAQMIAISDSDINEEQHQFEGISFFMHRVIDSMRLTMRQFDVGHSGIDSLTQGDLYSTVSIRIFTCIFAGIVFTRLIIGEIMITFKRINDNIDIQIAKQKLYLIQESQDVLGRRTWNKNWFPKAIVVRE